MPSPLIKIYRLEPGYSQDGDSDVQFREGDELLPVIDRSQLLADAVLLAPIAAYFDEPLIPIDLAAGLQTADLLPTDEPVQLPDGYTMDQIVGVQGTLGLKVRDGNGDPVDPKNYTIGSDGLTFKEGAVPNGGQVDFYLRASTPAQAWALAHSDLYDGPNPNFNRILIRIDGGNLEPTEAVAPDNAYVSTPPASTVLGTYAHWANPARQFCGDHPNWVADHLRMRPDIFVGMKDYAGDDQGELAQGKVPQYREPNSYALNARDGLVTLDTDVDVDDYPVDEQGDVGGDSSRKSVVRANYAHLAAAGNTTGQPLTYQGFYNGRHWYGAQAPLSGDTRLASLNRGDGVSTTGAVHLNITDSHGTTHPVSLADAVTVADVAALIAAANSDLVLDVDGESLRLTDNGGGGGDLVVAEGDTSTAADLGLIGVSGTGQITGSTVNHPETVFPAAVGKRWVMQFSSHLPRNIYVDDDTVPAIATVAPYEELTIKTES